MVLELGPVIGAIMVLFLYSWALYKPTFLYDISLGALVGLGGGYAFIIGMKAIRDNAFIPLMNGDLLKLIPISLGILIYTQVIRKTAYMARIPLAIIIGVGAGLSIRDVLMRGIIANIRIAFFNFATSDALTFFNSALILVGCVAALAYFAMTVEHTGNYGKVVKFGRYFLMITFGAGFGSGVLARLALVCGQVLYILQAFGILSP